MLDQSGQSHFQSYYMQADFQKSTRLDQSGQLYSPSWMFKIHWNLMANLILPIRIKLAIRWDRASHFGST